MVNSRQTVGLIALFGLLYSGLGWVGNLRIAIRTVWHQNVNAGNMITSKVHDAIVLVGLGLAVAGSVVVSGVGNAATSWVTRTLHLGSVPGITLLTRVVTIVVGMAADVGVFLWLFVRLTHVSTPWRRVLKGAVFAAVGFEVLKLLGAYYVARTTRSATAAYGALGVVIGALVWINVVCRFVVFAAVWTVTAPYVDDVEPSGTAGPRDARREPEPEPEPIGPYRFAPRRLPAQPMRLLLAVLVGLVLGRLLRGRGGRSAGTTHSDTGTNHLHGNRYDVFAGRAVGKQRND